MPGLLPLRPSPFAAHAVDLSIFGLFCLGIVLLGRHIGFVDDDVLLPAAATALLFGLIGAAFAAIALAHIWATGRPGTARAIVALLVGLPVLGLFGFSAYGLVAYPPVNDVSTNIDDPPRFWSADVAHPDLLGEAAAKAARGAYADLATRTYALGAEQIFAIVRTLVEERGWQANLFVPPDDAKGTGRIEATDRSLLFRFPDDIAVRITGTDTGSRVDLRSVSRYGRSDLGANARRLRAFLADLDTAIASTPPIEEGEEVETGAPPSG